VEYRKEELVPEHTWNPEHFCGEDSKFLISKAHETVVTFNIAAKSFNYFIYIPRKSMVAQRQPPYRFCITTISRRRTQTKASNAPGQPHHVILLIQILLAEDFVQHVHKTGSKKQLIKFLWNPNPFVITRWCRTCYMILSGPSPSPNRLPDTIHLTPPFLWPPKKRIRQVYVIVVFLGPWPYYRRSLNHEYFFIHINYIISKGSPENSKYRLAFVFPFLHYHPSNLSEG